MKQNRPAKPSRVALSVAALGVDLTATGAPADVRLIPAGEFRAKDGRPVECACWVMTPEDGARIVAETASAVTALVIDYEHATLHAKKTGGKAPAAGWFKSLEWRPDGLWAINVDWTALAAQEIAGKAYRYISPVFSYDKQTGRVLHLFHAALTNDPGLDGLTDLAALAADFILDQSMETASVNEELLEQLRWLLNLPVGTTAEEIATHLGKLITQLQADGTAAAGFDLAGHLAGQSAQIATLSSQASAPDPAKYVPIAALAALQTEHSTTQTRLAALQAEIDAAALAKVIEGGKASGKLPPAMESWARDLGQKDLAALTSFLEAAPVVARPGETQTGGAPQGRLLNLDDGKAIADLACQYQAEQAAKGITLTTVQSVAHITKSQGA